MFIFALNAASLLFRIGKLLRERLHILNTRNETPIALYVIKRLTPRRTTLFAISKEFHILKTKGDKKAQCRWTDAVIKQTERLQKIKNDCILKITFLLPPDKFPKDLPYGLDLDNLVKRLCDALNKTIFKEAEGRDSCVIELSAIKTKVESEDKAGAFIEILPIMVW